MIVKPSPWHPGEQRMHQRVGIAERMEVFGRKVVRDSLPDQHREFYRQLPFILLGTVDAAGNAWASLLQGLPGFVHSPDPRSLQLDRRPEADDPAALNLQDGAAAGLLGIELHTRRRNRVNGRVHGTAVGFRVAVEHAFGNCPQYIQLRDFNFVRDPLAPPLSGADLLDGLDPMARTMIRNADTCFVASYVDQDGLSTQRQVDVSHRGGKAGFIRVEGDCLTIPDFPGNQHFNTLGNLLLNPRAGLLFIDFDTGDLLHLSGTTEIVFEGPEVAAFQGAERLWRMRVTHLVRRRGALAMRGSFRGFSPNSLVTGSWEPTASRLRTDPLREPWRPYRVTRIALESRTIASFYLEPDDLAGRPAFRAGQHLPLRVHLQPDAAPVIRTYSLSQAPSDDFIRISVKREGAVSTFLHDHIRVGDRLEARAPRGGFVVDPTAPRPLVLLAAGVGITPLLSMMRHLVHEGHRMRHMRRTFFVQAARSVADRAFSKELKALEKHAGPALSITRVLSHPEDTARTGVDYELCGRIDIALLKALLPFDDFDFMLCGPGDFTQSLYDGLRALNVADERIHAEQFGPSTLRRKLESVSSSSAPELLPAATEPVSVLFARSGLETCWVPDRGSLLELAESQGLTPEFSCRGGSCGTCRTPVIRGVVTYLHPPPALPVAGEALICCAVPAAPQSGVSNLVLDV